MRSTRSTTTRDLIAVPAKDVSQAAPFRRVGLIGGVDERVIVLDDHSRRRVPDFGRDELRVPSAEQSATDVGAGEAESLSHRNRYGCLELRPHEVINAGP